MALRPSMSEQFRSLGDGVKAFSRRQYVPAFWDFVQAAGRAASEESARLVARLTARACETNDPSSLDLRVARAEFSSVIYAMASSSAPLRERLRSAMAELVEFMDERVIPDSATMTSWHALATPFAAESLDQALALSSDDDLRRTAAALCDIDARLRWLAAAP